jgi:hypothetical protein
MMPPVAPWEERPIERSRWERDRDAIMQFEAYPGRRPPEWWCHDRGTAVPARPQQAAALYRMGELAGAELDQVMAEWRQRYEHGLTPGFRYNAGADGWLQGAAARRAHHRWAGIPPDIVRKWDIERRRQAKVIRTLARAPA